jgi:hypothetical protein
MALTATGGGPPAGSREALAGLATTRYALAPLVAGRGEELTSAARSASRSRGLAGSRPVRAVKWIARVAARVRELGRRYPWLGQALRRLSRS